MRRASLIVVLVMGIVAVVGTLAINLTGKTAGVDRLTHNLKPAFEPKARAQVQTDAGTVQAMYDQLTTEAVPALAKQLEVEVPDFQQLLADQYPKVAVGLQKLPADLKWFGPVVAGLQTQPENFKKADAIPLSFLPARTVPWLLIVPGLLAALAAGVALARGGEWTTRALATGAACGAVLIVGALVCNVPGKAKAVDRLTDTFRPAFSDAGVRHSQESIDRIDAMVAEFKTQAVPGLAKALNAPPDAFAAQLAEQFPAVGRGLTESDRIVAEFHGLVDATAANKRNFRLADTIPLSSTPTTALVWVFIIPGLILLLPGLVVLLLGRRRVAATA
jgi:hypothetical protein